jgi:gliding motility-associated-like protein
MMKKLRYFSLLFVSLLFISQKVNATHLYGGDLFYTHVSGNTYTITLVLYGDCGGAAFPNLAGATATINISNGSTAVGTLTLICQAPTNGIEVTPVCPAQLSNTNCASTSGTIPGVKKFTYSANYTVPSTSSNWRFRFNGAMSGSTTAGRSNAITNLSVPGTLTLEATLNNTVSNLNSSPIYTTIPTPFFCINVPANNNPGTVDANGDSLDYSLVTGLNGASGTVSYNTGYSATNPIATSSGVTFSNTTGQLSFTPNITQRSLVVFRVDEYRAGVLIGTSMREMTVVVINTCNNNPPKGVISNASGGTIGSSGTNITICRSAGLVSFNINPTDTEGNAINVTYSGLPIGASFTIVNNNTTSPTGSFSWNMAGVTPGAYNFFVTYADDGCPLSSTQTIAYTIVVLADPGLTYALVSPATCTKRARFNMTPSGSPSPWVLTILQGITVVHNFTGVTSTKLDSLLPGTYTFRVTNASGCFKDTSITIAAPPAIIPTVAMVKPTCYGGNNGSITITGGGGLAPFKYALGSGSYSTVNNFTNLTSGTYTLHIRDSNECVKDTTVTLQDPPDISVSITSTKPKCNYFSSGLITVSATGGTNPYQYAIGSGSFSTTNTYSGLFSGTYILHVKDSNNCLKDSTFVLNDSISIHANATVTNILCYSDTTGIVTLSGFGGTSPYVYRKNAGAFSASGNFTGLPAASYSFRVKDVDSCYLDTTIIVTQPTRITSASIVSNVICNGQSNGSITITANGGVPPYQYALGSGSYSPANVFSNLAAGTYTLHIRDTNNCIKDTNVVVTQPTQLAISNIAMVQPICNGDANGTITITASGGTITYTYAIDASPFASSNTFSGIAAGTYVLHLKDNNNCTVDSTVIMNQPTRIVPSVSVKNSTCQPLNDGRVIVNATGGVPAYQYSLGSGSFSSTNTFTPLAAGSYLFHVRDTRGCVKDTTLNIIDSTKVTANYIVANVKCFADSTAQITINPITGVSPFQYAKGSGSYGTPNVFNGLPIGTYTIHTKDNLGCIHDTTLTVTQPTLIVPFISFSQPTCNGFNNGTITLSGTGGVTPYTYAMGTGVYGASGFFTTVPAGTFVMHVKDANNCIHDTTVIVTQPTKLVYDSLKAENVLCFGDTSGKVTIYASGGTPAYSYTNDIKPYGTSNVITGLNVGNHLIRLRDANNCLNDTTIKLTEPTKLLLTLPTVTPPTCQSFIDGQIIAAASGGTKPYVFNLNGGVYGSSPNFPSLSEGIYTVAVKDDNGCVTDTNLTITGYPPIIVDDITITPVSCFGFSDGKINLSVSGGIQPLTYKLALMQPSAVSYFYDLASGTYKIRITDSKNCFIDTSAYVPTPDPLAITMITTPNDCEGYDDGGSVRAEVTGGNIPYNYVWSIPNSVNASKITGVANGKYRVWVTDNNSCKDSSISDVVYNNCCKVFVPDAFTPNADGKNDKIRILFKGDFYLKTFMIYNRYGQRVFQTDEINGAWDGFYKGKKQDMDTYNYYIKGICGNGGTQEVEYKGTFMLIH